MTPSYLHGWSPDGKFLVYTGERGGEFDIYKIASDGSGEEIQLTDTPRAWTTGRSTRPDGQFIYFNSVAQRDDADLAHEGRRQDPEQVTNDEYNNWFPHLSPDGKWIVFLSFGERRRARRTIPTTSTSPCG